jgi:formate hydrogenlyase subunit 3/multisubunit Na+/H+ antiporter MnhD subunit
MLFAAGLLLIILAGLAALAGVRRPRAAERLFRALFGLGCVSVIAGAVPFLFSALPLEVRFEATLPGGPWVFGQDALSALFVMVIAGVAWASAWYGTTYFAPAAAQRSVRISHLLVSVLTSSLLLVVTARAVVPFLLAWELMAIASYLLIVFEQERAEVRRAGLLYIVVTHTGILALFALFALWGNGAGDLSFAALAETRPSTSSRAWIIALAMFGFGVKAGIVPLHFWLPTAHAAAPSHISALLSGVVIKTGIYGLLRVVMLLDAPPAWWGWLLLVLGVISGVMGVIWALAQHEIKRLLAFHSVENIGIILLGMGAGVLGLAYAQPVMAVLGFAGAALHTVNHALFKSLLFLGAGSMIHATTLRDIDRLGGVARHMPATAAVFLIASAAIVGLPPLNGFVSEWLVFRSLLVAGTGAEGSRVAVLGVVALALIGTLALACFAKIVAVLFLGAPRTGLPADVHESPSGMVAPMVALATLCFVIGVAPVVVLPPVLGVAALVAGGSSIPGAMPDGEGFAVSVFAVGLVLAGAVLFAMLSVLARRRAPAHAVTWACGYAATTPRMQYTASSFAAPLLFAFRGIAGVHVTRTAHSYATHATDPVMDGVVRRTWHVVRAAADRMRPIQQGRLSLYLLYIVATVMVLLLWLLLADQTP